MGPPPVPNQGPPQPPAQKGKEPDVAGKYSRLKRKYFELEEVSDRTCSCTLSRFLDAPRSLCVPESARDRLPMSPMTWHRSAETQGGDVAAEELR